MLSRRPIVNTDAQAHASRDSTSKLPVIRAKAERIVSLLAGIDIDGETANSLSLAEELAQEIADLCPVCGAPGLLRPTRPPILM